MDRLLDTVEAAAYLRMKLPAVRTLICRGDLRADGRGGRNVAMFYESTLVECRELLRRNPDIRDQATRVEEGRVYFFQDLDLVKIGWTERNVNTRAAEVSGSRPVEVLGHCAGSVHVERALHDAFTNLRVRGEWFSGSFELFGVVEYVRRFGCLPVHPSRCNSTDWFLTATGWVEPEEPTQWLLGAAE